MGAAGNKKPKKEKTGKHDKHVASYVLEESKQVEDITKKKK